VWVGGRGRDARSRAEEEEADVVARGDGGRVEQEIGGGDALL
jgi:hypothetical protein